MKKALKAADAVILAHNEDLTHLKWISCDGRMDASVIYNNEGMPVSSMVRPDCRAPNSIKGFQKGLK
jgi:hypothetical protein